jgi:hypothetical protein
VTKRKLGTRKVLTTDDAWRIAVNVAQLPALLGAGELERSPDHPAIVN